MANDSTGFVERCVLHRQNKFNTMCIETSERSAQWAFPITANTKQLLYTHSTRPGNPFLLKKKKNMFSLAVRLKKDMDPSSNLSPASLGRYLKVFCFQVYTLSYYHFLTEGEYHISTTLKVKNSFCKLRLWSDCFVGKSPRMCTSARPYRQDLV